MVPAEPGCWWSHPAALPLSSDEQQAAQPGSGPAKQREQEILQLARLDPFTGLPNRLSLMEQFGNTRYRATIRAACCFAIINDFKRINDNFGHSQGMLSSASWPDGSTTPSATSAIFARLAGDPRVHSAAALNSGYDIRQAEEVTAVIRQAMQAPFVVNDQPMQVGHQHRRQPLPA